MYKRLGKNGFVCDTKDDLKSIPETEFGAECYVIKDACEYRLMSTGEWVKQIAAIEGNAQVDLTGYATEEYVKELVEEAVAPQAMTADEILNICK